MRMRAWIQMQIVVHLACCMHDAGGWNLHAYRQQHVESDSKTGMPASRGANLEHAGELEVIVGSLNAAQHA